MSSLEQQLSYMVAGKSADVGIAALDLDSGESISIKGNTPFPMASTVKVAVAATYLAQVDHGRRSLDDTIARQPATKLIEALLTHSDNHATDLLLKDLGGPATVRSGIANSIFRDRFIPGFKGRLQSARRRPLMVSSNRAFVEGVR